MRCAYRDSAHEGSHGARSCGDQGRHFGHGLAKLLIWSSQIQFSVAGPLKVFGQLEDVAVNPWGIASGEEHVEKPSGFNKVQVCNRSGFKCQLGAGAECLESGVSKEGSRLAYTIRTPTVFGCADLTRF